MVTPDIKEELIKYYNTEIADKYFFKVKTLPCLEEFKSQLLDMGIDHCIAKESKYDESKANKTWSKLHDKELNGLTFYKTLLRHNTLVKIAGMASYIKKTSVSTRDNSYWENLLKKVNREYQLNQLV